MPRPRSIAAALLLCSSAACFPAVGEGRSEASPAPQVEPQEEVASPGGPLEVVLDGAAPVPPGQVLPSAGGSGHAEHVGWTPDATHFGHCRARTIDCYECRWVSRDGSAESIESGPGCSESVDRDRLDARLAARPPGPGPADWRWGADVVLVVETREDERTNAGGARPMLKLGARPREGGPVAWMLHVDPCEGCGTDQVCAGQAHLDALALSPDGREVVALVHGRGNDGSESMRLERLNAERLAEAALTPASRGTP